ncbi:unnamed protein product [Lampetra fluviatilis]
MGMATSEGSTEASLPAEQRCASQATDTSPSDTRRMASACLAEFLGATAELVAELDAGELSTEKIAPEPCGIDVDATWLRGDLLCRQLSGIESDTVTAIHAGCSSCRAPARTAAGPARSKLMKPPALPAAASMDVSLSAERLATDRPLSKLLPVTERLHSPASADRELRPTSPGGPATWIRSKTVHFK